MVDIAETGIGSVLQTIVPVAVLRSRATSHTAHGLAVHLVVSLAGHEVGAADVTLATLGPGAGAAVAGRVSGPAAPSLTLAATVRVAFWDGQPPVPVPGGTGVTLDTTHGPNGGQGGGDVTATLSLAVIPAPVLQLTAVCRDSAGTIVGGGSQTISAPAAPGPLTVTVPVVFSRRPTACSVEGAIGAF